MEPIVSVEVVRKRAEQAVDDGRPMLDALPYPAGTEAGQLFQREYLAALALRSARLPAALQDQQQARAV